MDNTVYANGYQCTLDTQGNEVVINFVLTVPIVNTDGSRSVKTTTVANIVLSKDKAENLRDSLHEILNQSKAK